MDPQDLFWTAARAVGVYFFMLLVVRALGKREVGNATALDLLTALMLGEVVDEMIYADVTMTKGFVAIGAIAALHMLNSWASFKSGFINRLTSAKPTVLVENGRFIEGALAGERMNKDELQSQLRLHGIDDLSEVKRAILEPSGEVSVIKQDWAKEAQKGDLKELGRSAVGV